MTALLALLMALPGGHVHRDGCCGGDDWRASLPANVREIVARVDDQVVATPPTTAPVLDARHQRDIDADIEMGRRYAEQVAKELPASENAAYLERVTRIGNTLAAIANNTAVTVTWGDKRLNPFPYTFHVLKGEDVNAFSIPGGFIYVYEGLIEFAETDHELAGVLAHEISHAAFRHIATLRREQSRFDIINIPLILALIFAGGSDAGRLAQGVGLVNQAFASGWSVQAEESADYGGLQYMTKSPYNPVGILTFMERLAFRERLGPQVDWGIYRTHPPSPERARFLTRKLKELDIPVRRSAVTTSFAARVEPQADGSIELYFGGAQIHRFRGPESFARANEAAQRLNAFFDTVPAAYELTVAGGDTLRGAGSLLFKVTPDDLDEGQTVTAEIEDTRNALRKVLFDLSYRLWPDADRAGRGF